MPKCRHINQLRFFGRIQKHRTTKETKGLTIASLLRRKHERHRTMVAALDIGVYLGAHHPMSYALAHKKIIDTPPHIALAGPHAVAPPRVGPAVVGMQQTERIDKSAVEKAAEGVAFLVGKAGVVVVGGRIGEI